MNNDIEKELKELQIQYDKVLKERNELETENKLLKKDLKEYQSYIKKGVEEHYKDFMSDYDVLLEECNELNKDLEVLEILKKHYNKDSLIKSLNSFISFHIYKDDKDFNKVQEWLENDNVSVEKVLENEPLYR